LPRVVAKTALAGVAFIKTGWIFLLPPTWFASYVDIAAGQTSSFELVPAAVSVGAIIVLVMVLGGRLSLDYAERLSAIVTAARTVTPGRVARKRAAWLFTAGEARAVALLIRGQFKNDMRFRMGVLAILPLTLIYLFMGISNNNGTVGDAFVLGKSAEGLRLVTLQAAAGVCAGVLCGLVIAWMRAAVIIFALFFGVRPFPGLDHIAPMLFTTTTGLTMLMVGAAVGALFAAFAFAISAFSIPLLLDKRIDALTAMGTSWALVWNNRRAMLVWGAVVLLLFLASLATGLLGLIIVFPWLGHATWHAYEAVR